MYTDLDRLFNKMFNMNRYFTDSTGFDTVGYKYEGNSLQFPVPGYTRDDINVELKGDVLYITGKLEEYGEFSFRARIPKNTEAIDINVENGIFTADFKTKDTSDVQINFIGDDKKLIEDKEEDK
jgi:HSP20 family molecular chaperone IbpA